MADAEDMQFSKRAPIAISPSALPLRLQSNMVVGCGVDGEWLPIMQLMSRCNINSLNTNAAASAGADMVVGASRMLVRTATQFSLVDITIGQVDNNKGLG